MEEREKESVEAAFDAILAATCPAEMKAYGLALAVMGYSTRSVAVTLRQRYPGRKIPHHSTISRWLHRAPAKYAALARWWEVSHRAAAIVESRMDEMKTWPLDRVLRAYARIEAVCDATEEARQRRRRRR